MRKNITAQYEYDGLGFPVLLLNVPLIQVRGVEVPDIDYNVLQQNALHALACKPLPLTGSEVKFIRQYLQMTYTDFAACFGVTHASVIHWEKAKDFFAKIQPTTELCIRLYILDILHAKNKLFRDTFKNFDYSRFKTRKTHTKSAPIILDSTPLWC